ncbi:unannotated protein [freshwater metagenome]|uniref:Unannotated protein n=1 Tax=freshwater metagenome TaxID=449393 RepID=A0A6J7I6T8_9ZZZZ
MSVSRNTSQPDPARRTDALPGCDMLTASEIPTHLASLGIVSATPHQRDDATVWDLELDGAKRRGLRVSLIYDARKGGALLIWAHLAPPLGDGLRKSYRQLLEWNDRFTYAKFSIATDGRPTLSVELHAEEATGAQLTEGLARVVLIADALVTETAEWIWIGGKIPPDPGTERRNGALLAAAGDLAARLEG